MDCEQALKLISALIDGELAPDEKAQLEEHLKGCADCRQSELVHRRQDHALRRALSSQREHAAAFTERIKDWLQGQDGPTWPRCTLLVVDDKPFMLSLLTELLGKEFKVLTANSVDVAQAMFGRCPIDLVLTDQVMPERSGVELLEWVRQHHPRTLRLLMTGYEDLQSAIAAINRGQVYAYFLKNPWRNEELLHTLRKAAQNLLLERDRDRLLEDLRQLNGELEQRVAERTRKLEETNLLLEQRSREMERLALTDPLTGLSNRRAIEQLAQSELKRLARYARPLTLGIIDVDHFKRINTEHHLSGGDEVLKGLANILSRSVRVVDSVGRVGGEEFLVVAPETNEDGAVNLAERIRSTVASTPILYKDRPINVTVSLGVAVADDVGPVQYQQIWEVADDALSQAKKNGRNRFEVRRLRVPHRG